MAPSVLYVIRVMCFVCCCLVVHKRNKRPRGVKRVLSVFVVQLFIFQSIFMFCMNEKISDKDSSLVTFHSSSMSKMAALISDWL